MGGGVLHREIPRHSKAVTFSRLAMFLSEDTGSITRRMQRVLMKGEFTRMAGGGVL